MLSCKEAARLVSASLDEELSFRQRVAVRFHLLLCSACCRFRHQMLFLREAVSRHAADAPDDANGLSAEARERIRRALEREAH